MKYCEYAFDRLIREFAMRAHWEYFEKKLVKEWTGEGIWIASIRVSRLLRSSCASALCRGTMPKAAPVLSRVDDNSVFSTKIMNFETPTFQSNFSPTILIVLPSSTVLLMSIRCLLLSIHELLWVCFRSSDSRFAMTAHWESSESSFSSEEERGWWQFHFLHQNHGSWKLSQSKISPSKLIVWPSSMASLMCGLLSVHEMLWVCLRSSDSRFAMTGHWQYFERKLVKGFEQFRLGLLASAVSKEWFIRIWSLRFGTVDNAFLFETNCHVPFWTLCTAPNQSLMLALNRQFVVYYVVLYI